MKSKCIAGVMSLDQNFFEFAAGHRARGFDEVVERHWPALTVLGTHEHVLQAKALVVRGDMWLTVGAQTHHLQVGSSFELDARLPHAESYGSVGATYWVARRHCP